MADLASLRIAVDSRSVDTAAADLDDLAVSAGRAEGATDRLAGSTRTTSAAMAGMSNAVRQARAAQNAAAAAVSGLGGSARLSANQMTNLSYQVQDLGVQLASGAPPMMAFIQQGSQIAGLMQASQMGVMGFTRAVIASTAAVVASLVVNPVFLGIAASVAILGAAVNFMASDITAASGVTVIATDVMLGAFDVLRDYLTGAVSAAFTAFSNATGITMDMVVQFVRRAVNIIIGITTLIPRAFMRAFEVIPQVIDKLMSGDFAGAFSLLGSQAAGVFTDSFTRDFVGEVGSVLSGAIVNRANLRIAAEAEETKRSNRDVAAATRDAADADGELSLQKQKLIADLAVQAEAMKQLKIQFAQQAATLDLQNRRAALEIVLIEERAKGHEEVARMMEIAFNREQALSEIRANTAGYAEEQVQALITATEEYYDLQSGAAQTESRIAREAREAEGLTKQLEDMGTLLDDIFGTNGKIGGFLNTLKDQFPKLFDSIKQGLDSVLQSLGTSMAQLSQGAQAGAAVAGMAKAAGLPSSQMGGQIGGAAGAAIGAAIPGVGPVIGSLVGGLLGSTLGGMIKGVKKASATIEIMSSNEVRSTVTGNESLKKVATGMADSLIKGLQDIADALGGELLAGMKISIGQRGSTFRVDPLGLGRTKGMMKFETEEEAIAYAMKLALEKGVITGIRESTQRLLAAGNDLQAAIEKSVLFESVFDRLLEKTDPLAYSMQKLDEEFEKLKAVFDEAGASLEEYAALQQLYAIEQQQLVVDAAQAALEAQRRINDLMIRLYDASGDSAASLALAREMELAAATEAEKAILRQIYAIEDFTAARDKEVESLQETIDTMQAFSDSLKDFRDSLFKADAGVASYKTALLDLMRVGGLASTGDATALGQLQGVSETFLTASMARASSLFEYQKDVALVAGYVDQGIAAAGEQIDAAQQQIDILDAQLQELISLNSGLDTLNQTLGGGAQTSPVLPVFDANQTGSSVIAGASSDSNAQLASLMADGLYTIAKNTGATYSLLDRWDGDGQPDIREYVNDYY